MRCLSEKLWSILTSSRFAVVLERDRSMTLLFKLPFVGGSKPKTLVITLLAVKFGSFARLSPAIAACLVGSQSWLVGTQLARASPATPGLFVGGGLSASETR